MIINFPNLFRTNISRSFTFETLDSLHRIIRALLEAGANPWQEYTVDSMFFGLTTGPVEACRRSDPPMLEVLLQSSVAPVSANASYRGIPLLVQAASSLKPRAVSLST